MLLPLGEGTALVAAAVGEPLQMNVSRCDPAMCCWKHELMCAACPFCRNRRGWSMNLINLHLTWMPTAANRYSTEVLVAAKHDFELQQDSCVHVHLDHRHMGVGGDDSWTPSVHEVSHVLLVSLWQSRHLVASARQAPHNTRSCCRLQW